MINVLFPIETIVRELDFKLLLAGLFARRRHRIYLARTTTTFRLATQMRGGLYVGKHMFPPQRLTEAPAVYRSAKRNGFRVVHLSEEGAVFKGDEASWHRNLALQLDPSHLAEDDYICTWGAFQRDHYVAQKPACEKNIRVTGHPRFDLYRRKYRSMFEREAEGIRRKYGPFVLVNTNFSAAVSPGGPAFMFSPEIGYDPKDEEIRRWYVGLWRRASRTVAVYVEMIHELTMRRPDVTVIVRPHPTEDLEYYKDVFVGVPNVRVVREGTVTPWLLACRAMVHEGCTTAIEAHFLGKPIVNFDPEPDDGHQSYLPSVFGTKCRTIDAAIDAILTGYDSVETEHDPEALPETAHALFMNFRSESYPRLLDVLREAEETLDEQAARPSVARVRADELREQSVERMKRVVRPLFPKRQTAAREAYARFPGFDKTALAARLEIVRKLTGNPLEMTFRSPWLVELTSPRA
jgi:surface carbohydrate biosynthesis protein